MPRPLRKLILLLTALCALGTAGAASALDRPHCEVCGRAWIDSPCRMRTALDFGKREKAYNLCSPVCFSEFMEDYPDQEPTRIQIMDFRDARELHPALYNVLQMSFLFGIEGEEEDAHPPFVAAFPLKEQAREAQESLGGELLDWEAVHKRCQKVAEEEEAKPYEGPPPLRKRERLDNEKT